MFNPDFYPTPEGVAATMLDPIDLRGRTVAELSATSSPSTRPSRRTRSTSSTPGPWPRQVARS
jgi:hypothetical protein